MDREYRILIVDDIEDEFDKYKNILEPYTCLHLLYARNGPEALEAISNSKPDIIFLDQYFYAENIGKDNLFFEFNGQIVKHESSDLIAKEHETNQGLYIIRKIIAEGFKGKVVFVTKYADDTKVGKKALELGASHYTSKNRLENKTQFVQLLEDELFIRLVTLEEKIESILKNYYDNPPEKNLLVKELVETTEKKRRLGLVFVKTVLKKIKSEHNQITFRNLVDTIKATSEHNEWQFEEINPRELLEWVLSKCDSLKKYKAENWDYEGTNGARYGYSYRNGNEVFYLRIVHPKFASNIQDINSLKTNSSREGYFEWVDLDKYNYELESNDPYWQGNHINIYLEKGNNGALIKEYVSEKAPLDSKDIKEILEKTKAIICASEPEWHGAISIESIFIKETIAGGFGHFRTERNVTISDYPLYNLLTEEGRNAIMGLSLGDKKKRDIQAFGRVADLLVSGIVGEEDAVNILDTDNAYFSFVNQCTTGAWDMAQPIPDSPSHVRIIPRGSFRSGLEEQFFYRIKTELVNKKCNSVVFLNSNIQFKIKYWKGGCLIDGYIIKEIDSIVLLLNQIYIIDTKGGYEGGVRKALEKMPDNLNDFRSIITSKDNPEYYKKADFKIVLADDHYNQIQSEINETDKSKVCSIRMFCDELKGMPTSSFYDLDLLENKLKEHILSSKDYPYELKPEFTQRFGNVTSTITGKEYDELHTEDYYIRRYSMLHALDVGNVKYSLRRGIQEHILSEKILNYNSSGYILLPISPDGTMFVDRGGAPIQNNLVEVKADKTDKNRIKIYVRWIYKFYKKPNKGFEGPLSLKNCMSNVPESEKEKLLYHYFKAIDALSMLQINDNHNIGFDENSLKAFKKGNTYIGVLEPLLNKGIQNDDILREKVLSVINTLNPRSGDFQLFKNEIIASRDNLRTIIKKYIDSYENKDINVKIFDGVNKILDRLENPRPVRTQQPMSSMQETTPVGQLLNQTKDKTESIDSAQSTKNISNKTDERIEGTIESLRYHVKVEYKGRKEVAQLDSDMIGNIRVGDIKKIAFYNNYKDIRILRDQQQVNREIAVIKSLPKVKSGIIIYEDQKYFFSQSEVSENDRDKLCEAATVSFVPFQDSNRKYIAMKVMLLGK